MRESDAGHECPARNCTVRVSHEQLACRGHWYSLPKPMRDRVWAAYRRGTTEEHLEAVVEAVAFLNPKDETS